MHATVHSPTSLVLQADCLAIRCPLGFVHGYHCGRCSWALLFPDCHVEWAMPFCYVVRARQQYAEHACGSRDAGSSAPKTCRMCQLS